VIVIGVEFGIIRVEVDDGDVSTNHSGASFGSADTEGGVLVLIHLGGEPDDDSIQDGLPLHLKPAVEQLDARVEFLLGTSNFIHRRTSAGRRAFARLNKFE